MRRLLKCPACGEWFNTTPAMMMRHYQTKHQRAIEKAFAIAELVLKREGFLAKAKVSPFPLSLQYNTAAQVAHDQLQRVIAETP